MSSTHLPVNKLVSTEKPGWVAARAEDRGSVKAVSTRGNGDRGKLRPQFSPPTSQTGKVLAASFPPLPPLVHCLTQKHLPAS